MLEIFVRLPTVTSLARAAFACRAFLRAVRSSPAFRRRFRELHAPPLLALFMPLYMWTIVPAAAGKGSDIAASFEGLLQDSDASEPAWRSDADIPYVHGYACFVSRATDQGANYNPYSRALHIYPSDVNNAFLEFHTLSPDGEEQRPSRVVCVHRDRAWAWACVAVFSSHTWQVVLPEMDTGGLLVDDDRYATGTVVNGFVCWVHKGEGCILALNTATFQFSQMDLPSVWKVSSSMFELGHTKDGKFCVVNVLQCMLSVWLWEPTMMVSRDSCCTRRSHCTQMSVRWQSCIQGRIRKPELQDTFLKMMIPLAHTKLPFHCVAIIQRKIDLESGLAAATDRVLGIRTEPNSMNGMELVTSESELAAARDRVLRIGTESDSMEGTERGSCWQMCKVLLDRACSRFFY